MNSSCRYRTRILRSIALAASVAALAIAEARAEYRLDVSGSPLVEFRADCELVDDVGARYRSRLAGRTPQAYSITAAAVACDVRKFDSVGRLEVVLSSDGAFIAKSATQAPYGEVGVRSAGPWGRPRATIDLIRIVPVRRGMRPGGSVVVVPPFSGTIVPPMRGTTVPAFGN